MKRILMATDLTARSDRALQRAIALAADFKAHLRVIHVVEDSFFEFVAQEHEDAARRAIEQQIEASPHARSVEISVDVRCGTDFECIIEDAEQQGADLVVLGIHRHETAEMFRGTTAERVVRYGRFPVLVVKDPVVGPYRSTLAAIDLSSHARAATGVGAKLTPHGVVHLVHVAHAPFPAFLGRNDQNQLIREEHARLTKAIDADIRRLATELGDAAPRFEVTLVDGDIRSEIHKQVASLKPQLLAIGTHGRTGLGHAILGSVAEHMLATAPADVVVVKNVKEF